MQQAERDERTWEGLADAGIQHGRHSRSAVSCSCVIFSSNIILEIMYYYILFK